MINKKLFLYNNTFGYKFIPNIKARVHHESGGYLVKTNNYGYRSDIDYIKSNNEKKRILVFGDSYTAGDGVSNKFRYTDIISSRNKDIEVYNFGIPGTGTDQQYLSFLEDAKDIEHDVLVISIFVENIRRVNSRYRFYCNENGEKVLYEKPYYEFCNGELTLFNSPVNNNPISLESLSAPQRAKIDVGGRFEAIRGVLNKAGLRDYFQRKTRYQPLPEYSSPKNSEWVLMKKILSKWIGEHNRPVIIMPIPLYQHIEETCDPISYQNRFKELSDSLHFYLHDPLPDMLNYTMDTRRNFRFEKDVHFTKNGHEALAISLENALIAVLGLDFP